MSTYAPTRKQYKPQNTPKKEEVHLRPVHLHTPVYILLAFLSLPNTHILKEPLVAEAPELTSQDVFQDKCLKSSLCAIAVFHSDEPETVKFTDTLLAVAKKHVGQFLFSWVDGYKLMITVF